VDPAAALAWHGERDNLTPSPAVVGAWAGSGRRSAEVFVAGCAVDGGASDSVANDGFTLVELMHPDPWGFGTKQRKLKPIPNRVRSRGVSSSSGAYQCRA
jgi:hypothetical protein